MIYDGATEQKVAATGGLRQPLGSTQYMPKASFRPGIAFVVAIHMAVGLLSTALGAPPIERDVQIQRKIDEAIKALNEQGADSGRALRFVLLLDEQTLHGRVAILEQLSLRLIENVEESEATLVYALIDKMPFGDRECVLFGCRHVQSNNRITRDIASRLLKRSHGEPTHYAYVDFTSFERILLNTNVDEMDKALVTEYTMQSYPGSAVLIHLHRLNKAGDRNAIADMEQSISLCASRFKRKLAVADDELVRCKEYVARLSSHELWEMRFYAAMCLVSMPQVREPAVVDALKNDVNDRVKAVLRDVR